MIARVPAGALRPGLSTAAAADTAWAIASPDIHDLLVRQAGYGYDQLEQWVPRHASSLPCWAEPRSCSSLHSAPTVSPEPQATSSFQWL